MIDLNLAAALPETFLAVAAMILLLLGVFKGRGATALVLWLSVACLALAFVIVAASMGRQEMALGGFFIADAFGYFMKLRSEGRRVGKECVISCRYRWSPYTKNKNH